MADGPELAVEAAMGPAMAGRLLLRTLMEIDVREWAGGGEAGRGAAMPWR
jgi:hypothetical protein